jgi:hypothetical protein
MLGAFGITGIFYPRKKLLAMIEEKGIAGTAKILGLTSSRVFKIYENIRPEPKRKWIRKTDA